MSVLRAQLHLHSCLSPCADDDMTPANIAGMAMLAGLDVAALTDHNATDNCPAFFAACAAYGVVPVGGMELTTAEEIHLVWGGARRGGRTAAGCRTGRRTLAASS